jgi:cell wall-associated NlpC family hydrolase
VNDPDPRLTLARADLADARLEGLTPAVRYRATTPLRCIAPATALRRDPAPDGEQRDQLLYGEMFDVLEEAGGWAWGQARRDGYVGYVARSALGEAGARPSHRVAALRTYVYAAPDVTSPASGPFSINSLVEVAERRERFVRAPALSGWMALRHLAPIGQVEPDFVAVAERFVGAAYLWGGREAQGVDCSGLVQQALMAAGRVCPRDADLQQSIGRDAPAGDLRRGNAHRACQRLSRRGRRRATGRGDHADRHGWRWPAGRLPASRIEFISSSPLRSKWLLRPRPPAPRKRPLQPPPWRSPRGSGPGSAGSNPGCADRR